MLDRACRSVMALSLTNNSEKIPVTTVADAPDANVVISS